MSGHLPINIDDTTGAYMNQDQSIGIGVALHLQYCTVAWPPRHDSVRQGFKIHFALLEGGALDSWD